MSDETKETDETDETAVAADDQQPAEADGPDGYARDNTVKLTMVSSADGVMEFVLRRTPTTAMALRRREHLGKPEKERAAGEMAYYVDLLSDLIVEVPTGVKDFPADSRPLQARVRDFFSDASNDNLLENVAKGWWAGTQPAATFLSAVSRSR